MTQETQTKKQKLEEEALLWEDLYYQVHGCMPSYKNTPDKYKKILWVD